MEEYWGLGSFFLGVAAAVLGLLSSLLCIPSELKRTKKEELKLDGMLCYLPESGAFKYGIGALIFLCVGQLIGNFGIVWTVCSRKKITGRLKDDKRPAIITTGLLVVSWISFVIAVTLLGAATSMNREQRYGKGWLDGECYLVKGGVFMGSSVLALVATCSILCSAFLMRIWNDSRQAV